MRASSRPTRGERTAVIGVATAMAMAVTASPASADGSFWDDDASIHERQIEGIAAARVTIGCDPPANSRDNFLEGTPTFAGRDIDEYQRYVVLHETGHYFDFDDTADPSDPSHYNDPAYCVDGAAPVMKQQSISLDGCSTNIYPLPFERDCVEEAWLADTTDQGDGDGDDDDQCPHEPTGR